MCAYCSQMDDDGDGDDHHVSLPHLYHSVMPTGVLLHPCRLFACLIFLVLFSCDIEIYRLLTGDIPLWYSQGWYRYYWLVIEEILVSKFRMSSDIKPNLLQIIQVLYCQYFSYLLVYTSSLFYIYLITSVTSYSNYYMLTGCYLWHVINRIVLWAGHWVIPQSGDYINLFYLQSDTKTQIQIVRKC